MGTRFAARALSTCSRDASFPRGALVYLLVHSSPLHSYQSDVFLSPDYQMPMKSQYRWVAKYPDKPSQKSSWMDRKRDVLQNFKEYVDNEDEITNFTLPGCIDPIIPESCQDPIYYLDKRLFMDDETNNANSFFIYTMKKNEWRLFRWKVQCEWGVFSLADAPAGTLHKGPWMDVFYECVKE